jgi:hypothetical protein
MGGEGATSIVATPAEKNLSAATPYSAVPGAPTASAGSSTTAVNTAPTKSLEERIDGVFNVIGVSLSTLDIVKVHARAQLTLVAPSKRRRFQD